MDYVPRGFKRLINDALDLTGSLVILNCRQWPSIMSCNSEFRSSPADNGELTVLDEIANTSDRGLLVPSTCQGYKANSKYENVLSIHSAVGNHLVVLDLSDECQTNRIKVTNAR